MKKLFTLAIIAMIASLTFAQAPVQAQKASTLKKVEKVMSVAKMQELAKANAVKVAKMKAAEAEASNSNVNKPARVTTIARAEGATAELPYLNQFEENGVDQESITIIDNNGDGKTWTFATDTQVGSKAARYSYNSNKAADDYIVFPALSLKAGKSYTISLEARCEDPDYPERLEVVAGTELAASALNISVLPKTDITKKQRVTLSTEFSPAADGDYYFAIHAVSDKDCYWMFVDNFSVSEIDNSAPAAVTDLTVIPDAEAALKATIKFTAPTLNTNGDAMTSELTYELSRGGEVIKTDAVAPGAQVEVVDDAVPQLGNITYSVVIYDGSHKSEAATATAYVGEDRPSDPENLTAVDLSGKVGLSWDAVTTGANGGAVIPANIRYSVYPVTIETFFGMTFPFLDEEHPYTTTLTSTQYNVNFDTNSGDHEYVYFGVTAKNAAGESEGSMVSVLTGAPFELPFSETLSGGNLNYWWGYDIDDDNYYDGGLYIGKEKDFIFDMATEGWAELYSGKINITGATNPVLSFNYKGDGALTVTAYGPTKSLRPVVLIPGVDYSIANIHLDGLADQPWVRFTIRGDYQAAGTTYVQDITVDNVPANNLCVAVSAPTSITTGSTAKVVVTVKNEGETVASDYVVKVYANGDVVEEVAATKALTFNQSTECVVNLETSVFDKPQTISLKAELTYSDENAADNVADATIEVVAPEVAPVETVELSDLPEGVKIEWTATASSAMTVVEDFESYDEMAIVADGEKLGDWTGWDVDNSDMYGWDSGNWPYSGEKAAFGIYNYSAIFGDTESDGGYNSAQAAMFMAVYPSYAKDGHNDDWMVSPQLSGDAQTISFMLSELTDDYGNEKYEVLASSTGNTPECFVKVADGSASVEWTKISVNLPEGTKYFAIRCISEDAFVMLVDDVTYKAGGASATAYNIYVDQKKVATVGAEAREYTATVAEGNHSFAVTAVYGDLESVPVVADMLVTSINGVKSQTANEVYSINGMRMNGMNLKSGVYVINGKKVVK